MYSNKSARKLDWVEYHHHLHCKEIDSEKKKKSFSDRSPRQRKVSKREDKIIELIKTLTPTKN